MAKRTYQITVEGPERVEALNDLLVALGFEKVGVNEYAEPAPPARRATANRAAPRRPSEGSTSRVKGKKSK